MRENKYRENLNGSGQRSATLTAAAAAGALGKRLSSVEAVKVAGLLKGRDPAVRQRAVSTLGRLGGKDAVHFITQALNDSDIQVRIEACNVLGLRRAHAAKSKLYDAVHDRNASVRCAAAAALACMGDKYGLPSVAKLVCLKGRHQIDAVRALNKITGHHFRVNQSGTAEAIRWIKAQRTSLL